MDPTEPHGQQNVLAAIVNALDFLQSMDFFSNFTKTGQSIMTFYH